MSEKRRPNIKLVAEKDGKRHRVELFDERQWGHAPSDNCGRPHYRVRFDGKWREGWHTITMVTDGLRRWLSRRGSKYDPR